ncbi:MAG TPA: 30S ribosomal protein S9 [Candidatus Bipolaricaulota bacterium]
MATGSKSSKKAQVLHGVGRRKTSVARVFLKAGDGKVTANGKPLEQFFTADPFFKERMNEKVFKPFQVTGTMNRFDVHANLSGGGVTGQMDALRMGIARALLLVDPEFRPVLRKEGLLTRDSRMVERKKVGLKKARRSEQYSKR